MVILKKTLKPYRRTKMTIVDALFVGFEWT